MEAFALLGTIVFIVAVLAYYGLGQNLEVGSRMVTRELLDAERAQKVRIVKGNVGETISATDYKKAVDHITKIDELNI